MTRECGAPVCKIHYGSHVDTVQASVLNWNASLHVRNHPWLKKPFFSLFCKLHVFKVYVVSRRAIAEG